MIAGRVAGFDRLAARLLAVARALARAKRVAPAARWRDSTLLWPTLLGPAPVPPPARGPLAEG